MENESLSTPNLNPILENILEQLLLPQCIIVRTDVPAGPAYTLSVFSASEDGFERDKDLRLKPSPVSILLRSLEKDGWIKEQQQILPDGIRDFYASHTLMEFKSDDPLDDFNLEERIADKFFLQQRIQM